MEETKELITTDDIRSKVYIIRGQQVMLDKDLAEIYGYEVKKLNQQVKRNIERFPEDFMFRLSNGEIDSVRSQIVTSRKKDFFAGQEGGRRYLPYAFTEQGIYMLATVLRGKLAEQQSIFIMRTFREMRHYIRQNQQFVTRNEMDLLTAKVGTITERQNRMENKVDSIQKDVNILADNFITDKDKKNFVIYKGIMQIELRTYKYVKYGVIMERYYVVLRCNPSIIMGDSKVFLVDLTRYTPADILDRLLKRIYEINEFRYIRLDKQPLSLFLTNRADIAEDIQVDFPQLVICLSLMVIAYETYRH